MSIYETLTLMIAFAMLMAVVINGQKNQLTVVNSFLNNKHFSQHKYIIK
ncbi:MAG: putative holin-like toxin [Sedimentibacter sp.]